MTTARQIIDMVAKRHDLSVQDLMRKDRKRPVVYARNEAFYQIRMMLKWSYPRIASIFGMDHATVIHGIETHIRTLDDCVTSDMHNRRRATLDRIWERVKEAM